MRLAIIQLNAKLADFEKNRLKIQSLAESTPADLYICPELSLSGYVNRDLFNNSDFLKKQNHEIEELTKWSASTGKSFLIGAVLDEHNCALLVSRGKVIDTYKKRKLPNQNIFEEKRHFNPGEQLGKRFQLKGIDFNVEICEDSWTEVHGFHADTLYQYKDGLQEVSTGVLINISASPFVAGKEKLRREMLSSRAKNSKCFFAYVNFTGAQDELVFDGQSAVYAPDGKPIIECPRFEEGVFVCDTTEKNRVKTISQKKQCLIDTKEAILCFIRDYVHKTGHQKVLLGVSGGIDSALCAALCVEAIGKENVLGLSLPSKWSSKRTFDEIEKLQKNIGFELRELDISRTTTSIEELISTTSKKLEGISLENLQARTRANILMALSNNENRLLVATSNKSELAMGYSTLYGDMSGAILPIGDLYKSEVYELSHFMNESAGKEVVPYSTITRPPSAELRDDQKDTDSLPEYSKLDAFLHAYLEYKSYLENEQEAFERLLAPHKVNDLKRTIQINEFKRKQAGLICKIHHRSFGAHWQMPVSFEPLD
jgi:NAD+ synthase (glutamine-hydrolysing)